MDSCHNSKRYTHILIVDDDAVAVLNVDTIRRADPPLPEHTVDPRKRDLLFVRHVHVDADRLSLPQRPVVVAVLRLLDAQLLRVAQLLPLQLEQLHLLVHPLVGRALHLPLRARECVLVVPVKDA